MENKTKDLYKTTKMLDGKVIVVQPPYRLDASVSQELKEILSVGINSGNYNFIVDFINTDFIDSSGLGALVSRVSICRSNDGDISLASINSKINEILKITHLDKILKCYDNLEDALDNLSV